MNVRDAQNRMVMCRLILALAITIAFGTPTLAQGTVTKQSNVILVSPEEVRITGEITIDTALDFTELRESNPTIRTVELDSPGGMVYPALVIANQIYAAQINTWITGSSRCYSACSLIFLAGKVRLADGKLGVHQISGLNDISQTQLTISDIYDSLSAFRTPDKLISIMLRTPPEDMHIFSHEELDGLGINIRPGGPRNIEPPHLQVISSILHKDWLVGTFMNNHTQRPFIAIESRSLDPVFRIVHYPHSLVTFAEIIWDEKRFTDGQTSLRFRFAHGQEQPYDAWVTTTTENHGYSFDIPLTGDSAIGMLLAAFAHGTSLSIADFSGEEVATFSLAGSMRASTEFANLMRGTHAE